MNKIFKVFKNTNKLKLSQQMISSLTNTNIYMKSTQNNQNYMLKSFMSEKTHPYQLKLLSLFSTSNSIKQQKYSQKQLQQFQKLISKQNFKNYSQILLEIAKYSQKDEKQMIEVLNILFGLIIGGAIVYNQINNDQWMKQYAEKYGKNLKLQIPAEYIEGNSVQKQLQKVITTPIKDKIKVVAGPFGIGKTTSIHYLINKLRQKGQVVYYMDIKQALNSKKTKYDKIKQLQRFLTGVHLQCDNIKVKQYKNIKIIIDNINHLSKYKQKEQNIYFEQIRQFYLNQKIDVICVSNSSLFLQKLKSQTQINKSVEFSVIKDLIKDEYVSFAERLITKYDPNISPAIKQYMIQEEYQTGKIVQTIKKIKINNKLSQNQQIELIKNNDYQQTVKIYNKAMQGFDKFKDKKNVIQSLQIIIKSSQQIKIQNCEEQFYQIRQKSKQPRMINEVIDFLDAKNLIFYCRPATKLHKKVFQQFLSDKKK